MIYKQQTTEKAERSRMVTQTLPDTVSGEHHHQNQWQYLYNH